MSLADFLNTDVGQLGSGLRDGLGWWLHEIDAMTAPLRSRGRRARLSVTAERRADGAYLIRREGEAERLHAPGDPLVSAALVLPLGDVLVRTLAAPALPERDVRRMIRLDLDRLTPFAAEAVYHDIRVSPASEPDGRGFARLAVVARVQADQAWASAQAAGIDVVAVVAPGLHPEVDFLPAMRAPHARDDGALGSRVRRVAYLWAAVGVLVALNVGAAIWRDVRDVANLQAAVAAQQPVVDRIRKLRHEVEGRRTQAASFARSRAVGEPLRVLDALSRALPDGAWVQRLAWDGQAVRIAGVRQEGLDVVAALRREPLLANARADDAGAASGGLSAPASAAGSTVGDAASPGASSGATFDVAADVPRPLPRRRGRPMNRLSAREQRLIALAILVGLIALAWIAVVSPILGGFAERREARATAVADIQRNARLISSFGAVRAEAASLRRASSVYAVNAASPPVALQAARERFARAVASQAGTLQALRNQPSPAELVRLQADMRITLAGLVALLHQLEDGRPYAAVDALSVTTGDAAAGPLTPLEIRLEVSYSYAG